MHTQDPFVVALRDWIEVFMHRSMRDFIGFAREKGLSMSQIGALFHIQRIPGGVSDLGDELGVTSAAASQMLERLVQMKLVARSEDPHDRRAKQLVLTDQGRQVLQLAIMARESWLEELAGCLSEQEKCQVTAALQILIDKARLVHA